MVLVGRVKYVKCEHKIDQNSTQKAVDAQRQSMHKGSRCTKAVDSSRALSFVIVSDVSDVLIRTVAAVANSITNSGGVDLRS